MVYLLYLKGMGEICLIKEMRFVLNLELLRRINLRMRFVLNLLALNMWLVHICKMPYHKVIVGVILHMLKLLHFLGKGGEAPQLDRKIMKVPKFKGVNVKEFLTDVFKSKRKSSYILPWK